MPLGMAAFSGKDLPGSSADCLFTQEKPILVCIAVAKLASFQSSREVHVWLT